MKLLHIHTHHAVLFCEQQTAISEDAAFEERNILQKILFYGSPILYIHVMITDTVMKKNGFIIAWKMNDQFNNYVRNILASDEDKDKIHRIFFDNDL